MKVFNLVWGRSVLWLLTISCILYMTALFNHILCQPFLSNVYQGLFTWGQSGQDVKLTTHFQLADFKNA